MRTLRRGWCRYITIMAAIIILGSMCQAFHHHHPSHHLSSSSIRRRTTRLSSSSSSMRRGGYGGGDIKMLVPLAVPKDVRQRIKVGDVVVPIAKGQPRQLVALGLYVGVEYRVLGIAVRDDDVMRAMEDEEGGGVGKEKVIRAVKSLESVEVQDLDRVLVTLKPLYRLTTRFEREWPVNVAYNDLPTLFSPSMYNAATLAATSIVSASFLMIGLVGRCFVSLIYVPSQSMYPSIEARDTVIIEGVSRFFTPPQRGDIIAFKPPKALQELVATRSQEGANQGMPLSGSELFVKRVGCMEGDHVLLEPDRLLCETPQGELIEPEGTHTTTPSIAIVAAVGGDKSMMNGQDLSVPKGMSYVVGDNPAVSIDSRIWGNVPRENVVGRVVWRLLPLSRFGPVQ